MRLLVFSACFCFYLSVTAQAPLPKFDVQGHRGARGLRPENTIPAFLLGLDSGVTTLEMDVVVSKDKVVIVSHDPYMSGSFCSDTSGTAIKEKNEKKYNLFKMTAYEISRYDCGSRGNAQFPEQIKMSAVKPQLRDVIVTVEDYIKNYTRYEVDYNVEIKSTKGEEGKSQPPVAEFADLVYQTLDDYLPMERVVIQSFDIRVLQYVHKKYPEVRLSFLVDNLKSIDENLQDLGFRPSIYSPDYKLLSKDEVQHCHALSMRVIPWTVNEVNDMLELKNWNVDGFITDYPDRAAKFRRTLNIKGKK